MTTEREAPLTEAQAKRFARWMRDNGFHEIEIVMPFGAFGITGGVYVRGTNRAGMRRAVTSLGDFDRLKEFECRT